MPLKVLFFLFLIFNSLFSDSNKTSLTFGSTAILNSLWDKKSLSKEDNNSKSISYTQNIEKPNFIAKKLDSKFQNSIRHITTKEKVIALTFDLCEGKSEISGYDSEIINYLRKNHIKATLFMGGKWMRSHKQKAMQLIVDSIFEIANHSWSHLNFAKIDTKSMQKEVFKTQIEYENLREEIVTLASQKKISKNEIDKIPKSISLFRFPYGRCSKEALNFLAQNGLYAIQWSLVPADAWSRQTMEGMYNYILKKIKSGDIIILHANKKGMHTAKTLQKLIPKLKQQGYRFITVSQMLNLVKEGKAELFRADSCYENRKNDNKRYDKIK